MNATDALNVIGRDERTRARIVAALQEYELRPANRFTTVRDDVTGPIVDELHASVEVVRKRLSGGLLFEFPYRSKIARDFVMSVPENPDHVWEPQTTKLLLHLSRSARHVIIGGAYFGDHAIVIADALRGRGTVHAFEPNAVQAAFIERNARLNGLENVRVQTMGLWSDAKVALSLIGDDALATTAPAAEGIPTTTIDAYVRASNIDRLDVIMLDLEGVELQALRGAERVLRDHAPHLVFEIHRSYVDWSDGLQNTEVVRWVCGFGYTVFAVRDFQSNIDMTGKPIELVPIETAYLEGPPHGFNLLAIRDRAVIENDSFRVTPHVSPKLLLHRDPRLHHPTGGL